MRMMTSHTIVQELLDPMVNENSQNSSISCNKNESFATKIFCDPVHGQVTLHPACVAIIDTPQFQRLRHIKQTSFAEYVYPGSNHNRFGHSIGVCYLAGKFLKELKEYQPELKLSETDILCVELAGLCHDLGHGPYSHAWENYMSTTSLHKNLEKPWKHELVSANMLDYLIEENNLHAVLEGYGVGPQQINLVKDYIIGAQPKDKDKAFLHQIVNNDDSGLDVDKWDYFLRDCLYLGLRCSFEYGRIMQYAQVFYVNGKTQICFRDKILESVYNVFRTRSDLHRLAYQHKKVITLERMFLDALEMADGELIGPDNEVLHFYEWSIAAAYGHDEELKSALEKFTMLTDDLLYICLKFTPQHQLRRASQLVKAMDTRSCKNNGAYQYVGLKILSQYRSKEEILHGICKFLPSANSKMLCNEHFGKDSLEPVSAKDISVLVVSINWGKGAQDPVDFVHFYSKDNTLIKRSPENFEISIMLPRNFEEIQVHVLSRRADKFAVQVIRWCFDKYWQCC